MKTLLAVIAFSMVSVFASAGSSSAVTLLNEAVALAPEKVQSFPISFTKRANYKCMLLLEPAVDFHGTEGKKIRWGGKMRFTVVVRVGGKMILRETRAEKIDHATGLWNGTVKIPDQAPIGTEAVISVEFHEIDQELSGVYRCGKLVVNQLPCATFLD